MKVSEYIKKYKNQFIDDFEWQYPDEVSTDYSVDTAKVIGVTGVMGKTSTLYLLKNYLRNKGYKVACFSTMGYDCASIPNIEDDYREQEKVYLITKGTLAWCLKAAEIAQVDYILLECHAEIIDFFDDLSFDIKILTDFLENHYNIHMGKDNYKKSKIHFFENLPTKSILNAESDNLEDFLKVCPKDNTKLFAWGFTNSLKGFGYEDPYVHSPWDKIHTKNPNVRIEDINIYPVKQIAAVKKCYVEYFINDEYKTLETILGGQIIRNIFPFFAIVDALNEWDDRIIVDTLSEMRIPGRAQWIDWNDRTIIIDSGSVNCLDCYGRFADAQNTKYYAIANESYKEKFGKDFECKNYKNIKGLFPVVGLNGFQFHQDGFCFLTPEVRYTLDEQLLYKKLMANIYKLITKEMPDLEEFKGVVPEDIIVKDTTIDPMTCQLIWEALRETYNRMFPQVEYLTEETFYNHSDTLLAFLTDKNYSNIANILIEEISNVLPMYINMLNNHIDIINSKWKGLILNRILDNPIFNDKIKKIYITSKMSCYDYQNYMIYKQMQSVHDTSRVEPIPYRKEAIKKMLQDSEPGDLLIVNGRGSCSGFGMLNRMEQWTDEQYIMEVIEELENK